MKKINIMLTALLIFSFCNPGGGELVDDTYIPATGTPTFSSTGGDGIAEVSYAPTPSSSTEAGTEISPIFSVDSDTGFAKIFLAQENDQVPNMISGNKANLVSGAGFYSLPFGIPVNLPTGSYQVAVDVAVSSTDYNHGSGTFTRYIQSATGPNYWQFYYSGGVIVNSFDSGIIAMLITVSSPLSITPQPTTCGANSGAAVSITAGASPSAFTSTVPAGGACYYKLTMSNGALNLYSLSLDSMTVDLKLSVFSTSGFFLPAQCLTSLTGASWYNCSMVQSDLNDILYIWVGNITGALGGSFRLVTP